MNSLKSRFIRGALILLLLFSTTISLVLDQIYSNTLLNSEEVHLKALIYSVISAMEVNSQGQVQINTEEIFQAVNPEELNAEILNQSNTVVWNIGNPSRLKPTNSLKTGEWSFVENLSENQGLSLSFSIAWESVDGSIPFVIRTTDDGSDYLFEQKVFRKTLSKWFSLGTFFLLLALWLLAQWSLQPLQQVASEVEAIEKKGQEKFKNSYPKELMPLVSNINSLLKFERLQKRRYVQTLDNLAHSLKTPLTALKNILNTKNFQQPSKDEVSEQVNRIKNIVDYQVNRASIVQSTPFANSLAVQSLVEQIQRALLKVYAEKNIQITVDLPKKQNLKMDEGDFLEAFGNLIENAAKYCRSKVSVNFTNGIFMIEDDGPGIPEYLSLAAIKRGVRLDQKVEGTGIGLSVAFEIIIACGGEVRLEKSESLGGTKVEIEL